MAFSADRRYIVKQVNDGDRVSLFRILHEYQAHVMQEHSLIVRFFAMFLRDSDVRAAPPRPGGTEVRSPPPHGPRRPCATW